MRAGLADDLALIRGAAYAAGRLALKLRSAGLRIWSKADKTPVTDADLKVDRLLKTRLQAARPNYGWLSEETADDLSRLAAERLFIVDPIDGTSAFLNGRPWFVVAVAVVEAGRPIAAAIYAPAVEESYEAAEGMGAKLNGAPIRASGAKALERCAMLGDVRVFAHPRWPEPWPEMSIERRNAIAYRMALVGAGTFDAAVALGPKKDWDLAAGDLIAREAGALVTDLQGNRLRFNTPDARNDGLICAAPGLHPLILARTAPIDLTG